MNYDLHKVERSHSPTAAALLPPAAVEETAWDILLALRGDHRCELDLDKLACLASVSRGALNQWLAQLERQQLIFAARHIYTRKLQAVLTPAGRELLDRYLAATSDLQVGAHH